MIKILIVEDEADIQEMLMFFLEDNGYTVCIAKDGIEAITCFEEEQPDIVLLDIMLPKMDGYAVCELIRKKADVPIIMITALADEAHQIKGLDLQADDYITKPFSMPVLLRKIKAILRRKGSVQEADTITYQSITLHVEEYCVEAGGKAIELTRKEFEILKLLLQQPGRVFDRASLLELVWPYEFDVSDRVIDNHIKNLRKKIGADIIKTVKGIGYKVEKDAA